jgi:hypothetical protein
MLDSILEPTMKLLMKYCSVNPGYSICMRATWSSNFLMYSETDANCLRWWKCSREACELCGENLLKTMLQNYVQCTKFAGVLNDLHHV